MSTASQVGRIGGPGSFDIPLRINLSDLQRRLIEADHPLGLVPQWNGDSFFLVHAEEVVPGINVQGSARVLLITAPSEERAEAVASANLKTRGGPEFRILIQEVKLTAGRQLQARLDVDG